MPGEIRSEPSVTLRGQPAWSVDDAQLRQVFEAHADVLAARAHHRQGDGPVQGLRVRGSAGAQCAACHPVATERFLEAVSSPSTRPRTFGTEADVRGPMPPVFSTRGRCAIMGLQSA